MRHNLGEGSSLQHLGTARCPNHKGKVRAVHCSLVQYSACTSRSPREAVGDLQSREEFSRKGLMRGGFWDGPRTMKTILYVTCLGCGQLAGDVKALKAYETTLDKMRNSSVYWGSGDGNWRSRLRPDRIDAWNVGSALVLPQKCIRLIDSKWYEQSLTLASEEVKRPINWWFWKPR